MGDPFRSELEAAHQRIEKLESDHAARVDVLQRENARLRKRLVDAAPPSQSKTGKTFFAVGMMSLGLSLVGGMFFARVARPSRPAPIFEVPVEIGPAMELDDETPNAGDFDRESVAAALRGVRVGDCASTRIEGHVKLTIAASGMVTEAHVDHGALADSPEARCIESRFRAVRVPSFSGPARTVGKTFSI